MFFSQVASISDILDLKIRLSHISDSFLSWISLVKMGRKEVAIAEMFLLVLLIVRQIGNWALNDSNFETALKWIFHGENSYVEHNTNPYWMPLLEGRMIESTSRLRGRILVWVTPDQGNCTQLDRKQCKPGQPSTLYKNSPKNINLVDQQSLKKIRKQWYGGVRPRRKARNATDGRCEKKSLSY